MEVIRRTIRLLTIVLHGSHNRVASSKWISVRHPKKESSRRYGIAENRSDTFLGIWCGFRLMFFFLPLLQGTGIRVWKSQHRSGSRQTLPDTTFPSQNIDKDVTSIQVRYRRLITSAFEPSEHGHPHSANGPRSDTPNLPHHCVLPYTRHKSNEPCSYNSNPEHDHGRDKL